VPLLPLDDFHKVLKKMKRYGADTILFDASQSRRDENFFPRSGTTQPYFLDQPHGAPTFSL